MEQNALEKLKAIGAEKIREATRLDLGKIEDILEKRFEKIAPVRAKGFISMLEKEFALDLSSWLEEYYQFHNQKEKKQENKNQNNAPSPKNSYLVFWIGCLGLMIVGGGLLYWITATTPVKTSPKESEKVSSVIEEPKIEEDTHTEPEIQPQIQEPIEEITQPQNSPQIPLKELEEYGKSVFPEIPYNEENVLFITANAPLWVGIINLDTKKRIAKTKKEFDIPLDKQLLISVARGGFSASLDDEEKFFGTYKPVYFIHTIKGGLKQIDKEEFIFLNGGVEW